MAKKTARDIDLTPLEVAERHHAACQVKLDGIWAEIDKMFGKTGDDLRKGVTMEQFNDKLREQERAVNELFRACDSLIRHQRGQFDAPTEPLVPEEDVRFTLIASLEDKTDELRFNVNLGILGSNIAKAIRMEVQDGDLSAPLCADHE